MAKRGPGYPSLGLKEAIERARKLYQQDGSAQTSPEVAVKAWGYGGLNGASLRVLAALRQYGLIEGTGDSVKLTQRALAILLEPADSPERGKAVVEAAKAPDIYTTILAEYKDELPSDAALVSYLVRKQGFQEKAAQNLVEAFRETVGLAKDTNAPYLAENGTGAGVVEAAVVQDAPRTMVRTWKPAPQLGGGVMAFNWPLGENQVVTVAFTRAPNQDDIATLEQYLGIAKTKLPSAKTEEGKPAAPAAASDS
jgi:hypothetical protein